MTHPSIHAETVTEDLREDDGPLGLALDEAVCPACLLAYFVPAGVGGVCRTCSDDPIDLFWILGV